MENTAPGRWVGPPLHRHAVPSKAGMVMTVEWEIEGQRFVGINGGPQFKFNEAVSFQINRADQTEVDYYREKLAADGGKEGQCGWVTDRYGLCWQVVPAGLEELLGDDDPERARRDGSAAEDGQARHRGPTGGRRGHRGQRMSACGSFAPRVALDIAALSQGSPLGGRQRAHDQIVGVLDHVADRTVGPPASDGHGVPVHLVLPPDLEHGGPGAKGKRLLGPGKREALVAKLGGVNHRQVGDPSSKATESIQSASQR